MATDPYTANLLKLSSMTDEDFALVNEIGSKERVWLHNLLKSVSPPMQVRSPNELEEHISLLSAKLNDYKAKLREKTAPNKNELRRKIKEIEAQLEKPGIDPTWPRYTPNRAKRCGQAIIVIAEDKERKRTVVFKFVKPVKSVQIKAKPTPAKKKETTKYLKRAKEIWCDIKTYKQKMLEVDEQKQKETEDTARNLRGFMLQAEIQKTMVRKQLLHYGYVPAVHEWSESPQLYCIMEYIPGEDLIEWCSKQDNAAILEMFHKIVLLVEKVLHRHWTIHADIKPGNILVLNGQPVLLDFGHAKNLQTKIEITSPGAKGGTPLHVSPDQYENFKNRSFPHDYFMLGSTLWCMWARANPVQVLGMTEQDSDGEIKYCWDVIRDAFPANIFPLDLQHVFEKSRDLRVESQYQDISYLRADIEKVLAKHKQQTCEKTCPGLVALQREIDKLREIIYRAGEKL